MTTFSGERYRIWATKMGHVGVRLCNGTPSASDGRSSANRYEYLTQAEALRMAARLIVAVMRAKRNLP